MFVADTTKYLPLQPGQVAELFGAVAGHNNHIKADFSSLTEFVK